MNRRQQLLHLVRQLKHRVYLYAVSLKTDKKKTLKVMGGIALLFVVILAAFVLRNSSSTQRVLISKHTAQKQQTISVKSNPLADQLNDISAKLAHLEQGLSGNQAYMNIGQLKQSLAALQAQVSQVSQQSNHLLSEEIERSTKSLQQQLTTIKKSLSVMTIQRAHHKQLSANALPFKVVSIDNIQQADVVSVSYAHRILPLNMGEQLAGWTLLHANDADQHAQFQDQHGNQVMIQLNVHATSGDQ